MRWPLFSLLVLLSRICGTLSASEPTPEATEQNPPVPFEKGMVRELHVTLLDEESQPVPNAIVNLYGQERHEHWPEIDRDPHPPANLAKPESDWWKEYGRWWRFATDGAGRFTVRFPTTHQAWGEQAPRRGPFYLVAEMPDGRRAVSRRIFHEVDHQQAADYFANEWDEDRTERRLLTSEVREMDLHLRTGRTITGKMESPDGRPLANKTVWASHDLHVNSHTGEGGEIFVVKSTTDGQGRFRLEHVYPVPCALAWDGEGTSRIRVTTTGGQSPSTRWISGSLEKLPNLPEETNLDLLIVVSPKAPTYRYFGTVTNLAGHPLAGVYVTAGVSSHPIAESYGDNHHFEGATTDEKGHWELEASAPWVRFFTVRSNERTYDDLGGDDYEDALGLAAPGEYHFKVKDPH